MKWRIFAPGYLAACLIFGGSGQGIWSNAFLQLCGLLILLVYVWKGPATAWQTRGRSLVALFAIAIGLAMLQLVPLPPWLWTQLPGGVFLASGNSLFDLEPAWRPSSMSPWDGIVTLMNIVPPLAMLAAIGLSGRSAGRDVALVTLSLAMVAMIVGAAQVGSSNPLASPWYFYPISNFGAATGFFANSNHMAALLLAAILASWALARDALDRLNTAETASGKRPLIYALLVTCNILLVIGLTMNGSLAGLALLGPAYIFAAVLFGGIGKGSVGRKIAVGIGAVMLVSLAAVGFAGGIGNRGGANISVSSRADIASKSLIAAREFLPFGSGIGTYAKVYNLYDGGSGVDATYVNHAHNDYLELMVEGGLPFFLLIVAFLVWWIRAARSVWSPPASDIFARFATGVTTLFLLHSLVDFPLRTSALAALFAASLGLMLLERRKTFRNVREDRRATRHVVIG